MLAHTCPARMPQGDRDSKREMHPAMELSLVPRSEQRCSLWVAAEVHLAAHGRIDDLGAESPGVQTVLPERRQRAVHEAGVVGRERRVAEAPLGHPAWRRRFQKNVGPA